LHDSSPASVHRSDHTVIDKIRHILVEAYFTLQTV
jgi:hypothetical protein